jgi:hypothetical protein
MREPDQRGAAAKAWIISQEQFPVTAPAFLGVWMVRGEPPPPELGLHPATRSGFHAAWDTWLIQACHLRPAAGVDPPKLHYPEAEYEIIIMALDPAAGPFDPDALPQPVPWMTPLDLVKQFHGCSDEQARRLLGLMVREICAGRMSPDSDYASAWEGVIDQTVSHYRAGLHGGTS